MSHTGGRVTCLIQVGGWHVSYRWEMTCLIQVGDDMSHTGGRVA